MLNLIKQKIAWLISVMLQPEKAIRVVVTDDTDLNQKINNRRKAIRRSRRGQITIEYFIIAAVLGVITLVGIAPFSNAIKEIVEGFVDVAAKRFAGS